ANFEKKYALAAKFAKDALAANPELFILNRTPEFAGWAVQAAAGNGADGAELSAAERAQLRRDALAWLRESLSRPQRELLPLLGYQAKHTAPPAPVRDPAELAKLPPEERAGWQQFWDALAASQLPAVAPPPRPVK